MASPDPGVVADWDELASAIPAVTFEDGAPTGSTADWSRGWYLFADGRRYILTVHVHGTSADVFALSAMGDADTAHRLGDETVRGRANASVHWRFRNVNVGLTLDAPPGDVPDPIWEVLFRLARPIEAFLERKLVDDLGAHRPSIRFATSLPARGRLGEIVRTRFRVDGVDPADVALDTSHPTPGQEIVIELDRVGTVSISLRASNRRTLISTSHYHEIRVTASDRPPRSANATRPETGRLDGDGPAVVLLARADTRTEASLVLVIDLDDPRWLLIEARVRGGNLLMSNTLARIIGLRVLLFEGAARWRWLESTMFALHIQERSDLLQIHGTFAIDGVDWTIGPNQDPRSTRALLLERLRGTGIACSSASAGDL